MLSVHTRQSLLERLSRSINQGLIHSGASEQSRQMVLQRGLAMGWGGVKGAERITSTESLDTLLHTRHWTLKGGLAGVITTTIGTKTIHYA